MIRVTSEVIRHNNNTFAMTPWLMTKKAHLFGILAKNTSPQCDHEKTSNKPNLRDILQNNWPVRFKSVKVIKDKERLKNCHRLRETKETWQLHLIWDSRLDLGKEKWHDWKNSWTLNKVCSLVNNIVTMLIFMWIRC